jgi:hypothetical protein
MTAALSVDHARYPGQQVEYVGEAIAKGIDVGAVTRQVVEHALSTTKCLSGSWEVHPVIVQISMTCEALDLARTVHPWRVGRLSPGDGSTPTSVS